MFEVDTGEFAKAFEQADQLIAGSKKDQQAKAETLKNAQIIRNAKIKLIAVGTDEAEESFLNQITGDPSTAFYVEEGEDISRAFDKAKEKIYPESLFIDPEEGIVYTWLNQRLNLHYREKAGKREYYLYVQCDPFRNLGSNFRDRNFSFINYRSKLLSASSK